MAPFSLCPKSGCRYVQDIREDETIDGQGSTPPLFRCPKCHSKMVFYCPWCKAGIHRLPTELIPSCQWCGRDLYGFIFGADGSRLLDRAKKARA